MKPSRVLAITSLMSILLFSFHLAGDIVRGIEKGQLGNLPAVAIFAVWMYGAVMLSERRIGYAITFLGSLLSLAVPILHLMGRGVGVESSIAGSSGGFFFIWTVFAPMMVVGLSVRE